MRPNAKSEAWKKWIKDYWVAREAGKPMKFDDAEKVNMIELAVSLDREFDEAVDLATKCSSPKFKDSFLYHDLKEHGLATKHPNAVLKLLLHLLPAQQGDFFACHDLEPVAEILVEQLGSTQSHRLGLNQLCELLAKMRCSKAGAIRAKISK